MIISPLYHINYNGVSNKDICDILKILEIYMIKMKNSRIFVIISQQLQTIKLIILVFFLRNLFLRQRRS